MSTFFLSTAIIKFLVLPGRSLFTKHLPALNQNLLAFKMNDFLGQAVQSQGGRISAKSKLEKFWKLR